MSATNTTTYYEFPVFVGSDKPAWLVDWNGAMNSIDSAIHEAKAEADANASSISSIQSDVSSLAGSVSSQGSSITTLTQSLTSLQGTVNTITSLIGNGEPTTSDKTLIGAINELNASKASDTEIGDLTNLTTTVKTNLVGAINEVNGKTYKVLATSTGSTVADQLASLYSAYNALSEEEKVHSFVLDAYSQIKHAYSAPNTFTTSRVDVPNNRAVMNTLILDSTSGKSYQCNIGTSGTVVADYSTSTPSHQDNYALCI